MDDVDDVVNSEGEHQLVEVLLEHLLVEPEDGQTVAQQAKQSYQNLRRRVRFPFPPCFPLQALYNSVI